MSRKHKSEIHPPSNADIWALKAAVVFANSEGERRSAQEKLDLATKLAQATKVNPRHRPEDEDAIKACSHRFLDLVSERGDELRWDVRDSRIANLAIDAVDGTVGRSNPTHAFKKILRGFELMRRDREGGDWISDAAELIRLQRRPRS